MTELKCPFCQQEMVIPKEEVRKGIQCCVCRNPNCEFDGWHFPVKVITALIDTKKKLDIAVDGITYMRNNCLDYAADYMDYADEILEQIKDKEQQ